MNLPFFVRLQSGLLLNLSNVVVIHPRQPNGSIRVRVAGSPLIVISPVTDEDDANIRVAVAMLQEWLIQQLDLPNLNPVTTDGLGNSGNIDRPATAGRSSTKKKSTKKRRRRRVAA